MTPKTSRSARRLSTVLVRYLAGCQHVQRSRRFLMSADGIKQTIAMIVATVCLAGSCGPGVVDRDHLPPECPPSGHRAGIRWCQPEAPEERAEQVRWCAAVGPPVVEGPGPLPPETPVDSLAVLSWNTHVGAGALGYLIRQLRTGVFTAGVPQEHFLVFLQETYRGGPEVPPEPPPGSVYADEIFPERDLGERRDVRTVAGEHGLYLYYVPSMRNGGGDHVPEDRGNAILSTLPLSDYQAWELPLRVQRRVAAGAVVRGETSWGESWRLSLVCVHLANRTGMRSFVRSFSRVRERQIGFLLANLDPSEAGVLAGDLNTWMGEREEPAVRRIREIYSEPAELPVHGTLKFGAVVERQTDFMFFRLPRGWQARYRRIDDTYGSDHYPLLGWIRFGRPAAAGDSSEGN